MQFSRVEVVEEFGLEESVHWLGRLFEYQRPIRHDHVLQFIHEMKHGTMVFIELLIAETFTERWLIDGQHRLWAVKESGISMPAILRFINCNSAAEVSLLYQRVSNELTRSRANIVHAWKPNSPLANFETDTVKACYSGIAFLLSSHGPWFHGDAPKRRIAVADRLQLLQVFTKECEAIRDAFLATSLSLKNSRPFQRSAVVGAMFETHRQDAKKFHDFWSLVISGDELKVGDPRKLVHEFILAEKLIGAGKMRIAYEKCLVGWRAYLEERPLSLLKMPPRSAWDRRRMERPPIVPIDALIHDMEH